MAIPFEKGARVRHIPTGRIMTVRGEMEPPFNVLFRKEESVECEWMDGRKIKTYPFDPIVLELAR